MDPISLRTGACGRLWRTRKCTFRFHTDEKFLTSLAAARFLRSIILHGISMLEIEAQPITHTGPSHIYNLRRIPIWNTQFPTMYSPESPHCHSVLGLLQPICLYSAWLKWPWGRYTTIPCSNPRSWTIWTAKITGGETLSTLTACTRGARWWVS